jgi:hypothetical protein
MTISASEVLAQNTGVAFVPLKSVRWHYEEEVWGGWVRTVRPVHSLGVQYSAFNADSFPVGQYIKIVSHVRENLLSVLRIIRLTSRERKLINFGRTNLVYEHGVIPMRELRGCATSRHICFGRERIR